MKYKSGQRILVGDLIRYTGPYFGVCMAAGKCDILGIVSEIDVWHQIWHQIYYTARIVLLDDDPSVSHLIWYKDLEFICRNGKKRMSWL